MSIAISHNMDNVKEIEQADLDKYFGLTSATGGGAGKDASGSKTMEVKATTHEIEYTYTRGGVTVTGTINYADQSTKWAVNGMGTFTTGNPTNRQTAIAEGLKQPVDSISFT